MLDLTPLQILRIVVGRYRLVLLAPLVSIVITYAVCSVLPAQYAATTTVVVDTKSPDPVASALTTTTGIANYNLGITTEAEIIASDRVARQVVKTLKLDESKEVIEQWKADTRGRGTLEAWLGALFLKKLTVTNSAQSNVVAIKFVGADPDFAALIANTFARAYIDVSLALKTDAARQYAEWFNQQEDILRANLEKAQAKMSGFQQERGIIATVEQQDTELALLADLEKQLSTALGVSSEALSKKNSGDVTDTLPEVVGHNLLTGLKSELSRLEAKLQESAPNLGRNHPQYQRMEKEIEALRENLRIETANVIKGFAATHTASGRKVAEIRNAFEQQKKRVLRIKSDRDQLAVLQSEVDAARKALDTISGRTQQSELVRQATQVQIAVLTPALAPLEPSAPKTILFTLLSIPLGLVLGVMAALALEQVDQRIRDADDLAGMLKVPVVGRLSRPRPPRWRRRLERLLSWRRPPGNATA